MPVGLLLGDDLMFTSRITGTARSLGLALRTCRTSEELLGQAGKERPACVLIDVHFPGLDLPALARELKESNPAPLLVAFGSHVAADVLRGAREAGCDLVLPRSKFVDDLPHALPLWFEGKL